MQSFTKIVLSSLLIPGISSSANAQDLKFSQELVAQVFIPSTSSTCPSISDTFSLCASTSADSASTGSSLLNSTFNKSSPTDSSSTVFNPTDFSSPSSSSTDSGSSDSTVSLKAAVYDQINKYRASRGLSPLSLDSRISEQAQTHSQNMANGAVPFGHDGSEQRVRAISKAIPYEAASENVASNQGYTDPVTQAVQGWIKSEGHRRNIEGQYNLTGIGIALNANGEYYFTQIFVNVP